ncbi:MAG: ATP-binding protein [Pseudomonadota bacterium]
MGDRPDNNQNFEFTNSRDELRVLKAAIERVPVAISISRRNGDHLYHNPCFQEMFGYQVHELDKSAFDSLFVDALVFKKIIQALKKDQSWSGEVEMKDKSGRLMPVSLEVESVKDESGQTISFIGTYTDITELKASQKEIRYQSEYLSTLHSISLGMFRRLNLSDLLNAIIVRACKITKIPNGFLHLYDPEEGVLVMKAACGNLTPSIGYKIKPGTGIGGGIFKTGEPMIIDNYQEWARGIKDPLFNKIYSIVGIPLISGSKVEGVIALCHHKKNILIDSEVISILEEFSAIAQIAIDNARLFENQRLELERRIELEKERKEIEIKLQQSQRMESIGTLAGGIAHDFNNILSSIMGFAQIAMADAPEKSSLADDLNEIYNASIRARDLTRQILTFARQTDEQVIPLKISIVAKEVLKFIRSSIPSTIDIQQNIVSRSKILLDASQAYQIFLNLFTNAAQAMEKDGGRLTVVVVDELLVEPDQSVKPGEYVKIQISDTGIGIAPEHIQTIFDPYFTTKAIGEGTGLGLSVVHGAVKGMGGEIFVESKLGQGTMFTLYFPIVQEMVSEFQFEPSKEKLPEGNGEHIMVVDDEEPITRVQKRMLEQLNYKVTTFNDSFKALDFFKANPNEFSAVLTDMTMPNMTGDKLIQAIREIQPDMPVILCTGFTQYLTKEALMEKGIKYYCPKPILNSDLAIVVRAALDRIEIDHDEIDSIEIDSNSSPS